MQYNIMHSLHPERGEMTEILLTLDPQYLVEGSCMTEQEIIRYSRGRALCGWRIKAGSVVEYEIPLPLEFATDLKCPPGSWCYLHKEYENE